MTLEETIRANELFDAYGVLLTQNQQDVLVAYISQNESLGEIAVKNNTTRQAVSDLISRAILKLENYESKLHLVEKFNFVLNKIPQVAHKLTNNSELEKEIVFAYTDLFKRLED